MGIQITEAQKCAYEIKHLYESAGIAGYSQEKCFYDKISTLAVKAGKSKYNKSDAEFIQETRKPPKPIMKEMEQNK